MLGGGRRHSDDCLDQRLACPSMTDCPYGILDPASYQAVVRREADALLAAVEAGPHSAQVAACPGWTVLDLVDHVGKVHQWATAILTHGNGPDHETVGAPPGADLHDWYADQVDLLLRTLAATDPARPVWTFQPGQRRASFWSRRQAFEVTVHRVDAELAIGHQPEVEPTLAADGVGEVLDVMLPRVIRRSGHPDLGGPVLLACTDRPERWLLRPGPAGDAPVTAGPAVGDADAAEAVSTLRGPAAGLLLTLWKRPVPAPAAIRVTGDADVARRLLASRFTP